jgi:hypothetical protein
MKAKLVHVETGIEYYKNNSLYIPSSDEKLLWSIFGMPKNIEILEQTFETEIDEFRGYTKREIEAKLNENIKKGVYNYLPTIGINHNIELRF